MTTTDVGLKLGPYLLHPSGAVTKMYWLYWYSSTITTTFKFSPPTEDKPLTCKRLGVKDIYDLKGVRTNGGNRAYRDLLEPALAIAPALQRLIDVGAVVVRKTKITQFALGERQTDGYQNPQGSSAGTGAGLASYKWMDIATGSDTGGPVRLPDMTNGPWLVWYAHHQCLTAT